jgi:hypothetical protein
LPAASVGDQLLSSSSFPSPVLYEEIGQGASGASVHHEVFNLLDYNALPCVNFVPDD